MRIHTKNKYLDVTEKPCVMGVVNCTPDSFYDGGRYSGVKAAVERGISLAGDGADILDIGGESTRPGAESVPEAIELERVIPVIRELRRTLDIPISVDTRKAAVAEAALSAGADIINDISGLRDDPFMITAAVNYACPVIVMHMKGAPGTMQNSPHYDDVISEINAYFIERIRVLRAAGVSDSNILLDPGIGFGKRLQDNYRILKNLHVFAEHGYPLVVGPSRKRFIGDVLNLPVEERLEGTAAAVAAAVLNGAHIIRVHDVREMVRVVRVAHAVNRPELL